MENIIRTITSLKGAAIAAAAVMVLLALVSCSGGGKDGDPKEEPKTAREIMKTYTNTLATAPDRARDAGSRMEQRNKDALKDFE